MTSGQTVASAGPSVDRASEVADKLTTLRAWLRDAALDAVLLGSQAGFAWITAGGDSHISLEDASGAGSALVTSDAAFVLSTNIERRRLSDEELSGLGFEPMDWPWHEPDRRRSVLARLCDVSSTASDLPGLDLTDAGRDLARLRLTLVPSEVERYRALGRDAALAVEAACAAARPGASELEVAAAVAAQSYRHGMLPLVNLVAADERIARYRHPIPTRHVARRTLMVALTARRHGLHASLTRMVSFGAPDEELARRHAAVTRIDARYLLGSRPGATLGEVVEGGVAQYAHEGFPGEWMLHHQGGLTGYAGREIFGAPGAVHRLEASQAVAWNPSITSVKSEDTALVGDHGVEILTRTGSWPEVTVRVAAGRIARPGVLELA